MSELLLELKPGCSGCPQQAEAQHELLMLSLSKRIMLATGSTMVGESGEQFDEFLTLQLPADEVDEAKQNIRKFVGNNLEDIDRRMDEVRSTSQELTASCDGRLRMRAAKAGVVYTVSICTASSVREVDEYEDGQALTAYVLATPGEKMGLESGTES